MSAAGDLELERAERLQRLIVAPMVAALRSEMQEHLGPLVKAQADTDRRVDAIAAQQAQMKANEKKALAGWGVYATAMAAIGAWLWGSIRSHFHWS